MKVAERLDFVDRECRYSCGEIDNYFSTFEVELRHHMINIKSVYEEVLACVDRSVLVRITDDLDMDRATAGTVFVPPQRWANTQDFPICISHKTGIDGDSCGLVGFEACDSRAGFTLPSRRRPRRLNSPARTFFVRKLTAQAHSAPLS